MVRDWSATTSYAWMPSTATNYTITVWARSAGVYGRRAPGISAAGVCDQHTAAGAGDERDADVQMSRARRTRARRSRSRRRRRVALPRTSSGTTSRPTAV